MAKEENAVIQETPDSKPVKKDSKPKKSKDKKPNIFKRFFRYFKDLKSEFKKVVWPTKKQVLNNTTVVVVFSGIVAVVIWLLDSGFINLFKLFY